MDRVAFGKRVREARKNKGITQERLAEMADIGASYLGEIERGEKTPSLDTLIRLAESLVVSCDYLLRDIVERGADLLAKDIYRRLVRLTPRQRAIAETILSAYIESL